MKLSIRLETCLGVASLDSRFGGNDILRKQMREGQGMKLGIT